jgi:hypothetical protein
MRARIDDRSNPIEDADRPGRTEIAELFRDARRTASRIGLAVDLQVHETPISARMPSRSPRRLRARQRR